MQRPRSAVLIALLALGLIAAFAVFSSARTELAFAAAVIAGASGVYSAYYGAANLREELVRIVRQHHELEGAARSHLNFIHAIAIQRDIVDEETVHAYFHLIVRDTVNLLDACIDHEQRSAGRQTIWSPVQWLDRRWSAR